MTTAWAKPPAMTALRVLIVEDHRDGAESLATLLRLWGHEARVVRDGAAALEAAASERPDVVLLDIGLPGMDGYEVAERLREGRPRAMPLVIAVTGYGDEEARLRAAEAGIDLYLLKPADPQQLQALLANFRRLLDK
jgi:CheY-like chemotaxis protein